MQMQTLKIYVSSLRCLSAHFTEKRKFVVANQLLASILGFPFIIIQLFYFILAWPFLEIDDNHTFV